MITQTQFECIKTWLKTQENLQYVERPNESHAVKLISITKSNKACEVALLQPGHIYIYSCKAYHNHIGYSIIESLNDPNTFELILNAIAKLLN